MVDAVQQAVRGKSWKTTAFGFLSGVAILVHQAMALLDDNPATVFSVEATMTGLGLLGIGIFARDHGVTSDAAGLHEPKPTS